MNVTQTKESFEKEVYPAVAKLHEMFGNAHGDRVVALALMNPVFGLATPMSVVGMLAKSNLAAGGLWVMFKDCGGVSKEEEGALPESEQRDAVARVWDTLCRSTAAS